MGGKKTDAKKKQNWAERWCHIYRKKWQKAVSNFILHFRRDVIHYRERRAIFTILSLSRKQKELMQSMCFRHFLNTVEWIKNPPARYVKACTLFQNTHTVKWHRRTQSCFYFAKGNGVKNTTIKIIFISEKLQLLASTKSRFLFFSGGRWLSLTQVLVLKMNCLKWCQCELLIDLQSIPPGPPTLAADVGPLCPRSAARCGTSASYAQNIKKKQL